MQAGVNTIAIQGIDLQVVRQGTGRPLFLLHGGDGPQGLVPLLTRLAERFDVSAPTHPGSAGTAIPEHLDTLEDLVYLYLDLLDVLDLHDVILSGCRPWGDGASGHPISLRKKPSTGRKKKGDYPSSQAAPSPGGATLCR